jgi:hypothetical protein
MSKVDYSPEDLACMQSMYEHAVMEAKQELAAAISTASIWDGLMKEEVRMALAAHLDEVSCDRLQTLALDVDLLKEPVKEWAYGKPVPEML